ncbi:MAG: NAD(+) diphosphatase [Rhodothalassiaceae bacterium]
MVRAMSFDAIACAFTGMPLDRADHHRGDPDWIAARRADPASRFLAVHRGRPAVSTSDGRLRLAWGPPSSQESVFLGLDRQGLAHFAFEAEEAAVPPGAEWIDGRQLALQLAANGAADPDLAVAGLARCLTDWHARHRFCAVCGGRTEMIKGGYARRCLACGAEHYPRVDPVVIMLVVRGDRCLLGRQARFPPGMYSALAGFVEPGESIEEAVRREVLEEAGVRAGAVRYVCSQPWPFPSSLMLGCIAEGLTDEITPDETEIEHADWFARDRIAAALNGVGEDFKVPPAIAIAHQLMKVWSTA